MQLDPCLSRCPPLWKSCISCQLDLNSCFPLHADQHFCNLQPHARTICCTNDTSRNVTECSNSNARVQFPQAIPHLIISDHYWFSVSRTFLLQVCHCRATFNYTSKSQVTQLSSTLCLITKLEHKCHAIGLQDYHDNDLKWAFKQTLKICFTSICRNPSHVKLRAREKKWSPCLAKNTSLMTVTTIFHLTYGKYYSIPSVITKKSYSQLVNSISKFKYMFYWHQNEFK